MLLTSYQGVLLLKMKSGLEFAHSVFQLSLKSLLKLLQQLHIYYPLLL